METSLPLSSNKYIVSVIAAYWIVSISMVYLNKYLLSTPDASIPAPLFVTWFQSVSTCGICIVLGHIGNITRRTPPSTKAPWLSVFDKYHVVTYTYTLGMKVLPLSLIFVGMVTANNLCLQYVEVSFYNVARSLTIIASATFTYLILGQKIKWTTMCALAVVLLGFIVGINGEINFSFMGTLSGVASSLFVALNGIYTKKISSDVQLDNAQLLYYNNFNACILFLPLIILFEYNMILEHAAKLRSVYFWSCMILSGFVGFAIGLVTVMQVNATSPLTHNISGTAKAAAQSLLAFYIWGNQPTFNGILGIFLVFGGSLAYTYYQMLANEEIRKAEKAAKEEATAATKSKV